MSIHKLSGFLFVLLIVNLGSMKHKDDEDIS